MSLTQMQALVQHLITHDKRSAEPIENIEISKCEECGRPFPKTTANRKYCWIHSTSKVGKTDREALSDADIFAKILLYWYTSDNSTDIIGFHKTITIKDRRN